MEAPPVCYSMQTGRQTDMTKLVVVLRKSANAPKSRRETGIFPRNSYAFRGYGSACRVVQSGREITVHPAMCNRS